MPAPAPGHGSPPAPVLCLHGFSGCPDELRPLLDHLGRAGHPVVAPVLPGHGGSPRQLARVDEQDWVAAAEAALLELARRFPQRPLAVTGFSMGGLLALRLAYRHPRLIGRLVLLSTALELFPAEALVLRGLAALLPSSLARAVGFPKLRVDLNDPALRRQARCCPGFPLNGLIALRRLALSVRGEIPTIAIPALILHGLGDRAIPWQMSLRLWQSIGSEEARFLLLERSAHLVALDYDRERVCHEVAAFLAAGSTAAARA